MSKDIKVLLLLLSLMIKSRIYSGATGDQAVTFITVEEDTCSFRQVTESKYCCSEQENGRACRCQASLAANGSMCSWQLCHMKALGRGNCH